MALTICLTCGHPFTEHEASGCQDISGWSDDYPDVCDCPKTATEVLRQVVAPADDRRGEEGRG